MLFNSLAYIFFLIIVFTVYWILKDKYRWILLVIASYFFYMCSGPVYGLLIFGITSVSYISAMIIEKYNECYGKNNSKKSDVPETVSGSLPLVRNKQRRVLIATIVICLGVLFFFKYFDFFSSSFTYVMNWVGVHQDPITLHIVLPVGISFYTFQAMSYVIDVYRGSVRAERHFGKFAAFVSFFPQLVAGPIERAKNLLAQINKEHIFDHDQAMQGVKLMLWGYYKKLVIADFVAPYVQRVFDAPQQHQGFSLVVATLLFTIQIYCDFSGYSDIAIGTAKLFGIDLMTNFKSPYFATSIREFWSRWHISLSTWFRDYVYFPLGGSRVSRPRHYLNLMITFLASGLWHGANWTFIVWGGLHGMAQTTEDIVAGRAKEPKHLMTRMVRTVIVFAFCSFAWVFFVSNSIEDAFYVIGHCLDGISNPMLYLYYGFASISIDKWILGMIVVSILIMAIYDWFLFRKDNPLWIVEKNKAFQWGFFILIGLMVIFFSEKGVASEFIYFQF